MNFFAFDILLEEETREEYLDSLAEDGYQRRQQIMNQIREEISSLDTEAKDAFWEGWFS